MAAPETALLVTEDEATGNRFVTYTTKGGVGLELHFDGEQPWFTQRDIATMFGVDKDTVADHISKFMDDGELDEATTWKFPVVRLEGSRRVERQIQHYNLDVAFYVGYRVNSAAGKQFRKWATQMLVQLATKGFVVDRRKLSGDADRLRELRAVIADLRSDEANMYAELRRICSMCKDYDPSKDASRKFFALFQNRMLYAITG